MSSQTDLTALDDTLAGRLTQAGITGASLALPDYVDSRLGRFALNILLTVGGVGMIAYLQARDENSSNDSAVTVDRMRQEIGDIGRQAGPGSDTSTGKTGSPLKVWALLIGVILLAILLSRLEFRARRWLVNRLRDRGVTRPHTVLGGIGAVLVYAFSEYMHRENLATQCKAVQA